MRNERTGAAGTHGDANYGQDVAPEHAGYSRLIKTVAEKNMLRAINKNRMPLTPVHDGIEDVYCEKGFYFTGKPWVPMAGGD